MYARALWWGLLGSTVFPVLILTAGYLLCAMAFAVALMCVIGFPVAAIFFPRKLLDVITPTDNDREITRRIDARLAKLP